MNEPISDTILTAPTRNSRWLWVSALLIFAIGASLRIFASPGFTGVGFDEHLYQRYVVLLNAKGLTAYPAICDFFIHAQTAGGIAELPPTRFLYIATASLWSQLFGPSGLDQPGPVANAAALSALQSVSCLFSILFLIPSALFARRLRGDAAMLGTLALLCFAPVQIHLAQHRMIDGFFAFWALMNLWLLWENLRVPHHPGRLLALTICLAAMVMTKENSFFVFAGLGAILALNRWGHWGTVTPKLVLCMIAGPLVGLVTLITLAGGTENFFHIYQLLVTKAQHLDYAIRTGDGPWFRYCVDYLLVSPIIFLLAVAAILSPARNNRSTLYLIAFIIVTYAIMCNIKYGMNLRYTTIWDMPLRLLAYTQLARLTEHFGPRQKVVLTILIIGICAYELRQYEIFFQKGALYELVSGGLLHCLDILKFSTPAPL